ncbi:MAG: hypothetical protein JSS29_02200 [Proteobacteria bacterium]|nr:hypothetical protein [Pseudomonadota bacterium]
MSAGAVFVAATIVGSSGHNVVSGHVLTPLEMLPSALILAALFAPLALLGTWLGVRYGGRRDNTYRTGLVVALLYGLATYVVDAATSHEQTVKIPSREADILFLESLAAGVLWGVSAPWAIAFLLSRLRRERPVNP